MDTHSRNRSGIGGFVVAMLMILMLILGLTPGRSDAGTTDQGAIAAQTQLVEYPDQLGRVAVPLLAEHRDLGN